jgi:hypothetical protein
MARKISRWATAIAAGVTIATGGLLVTGGPASAAAQPAQTPTIAAVSHAAPSFDHSHAAPSFDHSYGEGYASGRLMGDSSSQYSDGYSWYRQDYGLLYRWDGGSWVAQTAGATGVTQSLDYRYDDGLLYHWDGTQWAPGTGRPDDITQGASLSPDPQSVERA